MDDLVWSDVQQGWSAQQGEESLDSRVHENDELESVDTSVLIQTKETQNRSRSTRKRKVVEMIAESSSSRDALLMRRNEILERILREHPDYKYNVMCAVEILNELSNGTMWSPFYRASLDHLMGDVTHRQAFLAYRTPEDKISYLEHKTGKKHDD